MRLVKDWIRSVKVLVSPCDSDLQVARSHHIPRVRLRPWVSLVALQEVEDGGETCLNRLLIPLKGGRGCGKLAARSAGSLFGEESEMEARCNFFQKLEQNRIRRQGEHNCCLPFEDGSFGKEVVNNHSLMPSLGQKMEDPLSPAFRQYLASLRQPRHLWYPR